MDVLVFHDHHDVEVGTSVVKSRNEYLCSCVGSSDGIYILHLLISVTEFISSEDSTMDYIKIIGSPTVKLPFVVVMAALAMHVCTCFYER